MISQKKVCEIDENEEFNVQYPELQKSTMFNCLIVNELLKCTIFSNIDPSADASHSALRPLLGVRRAAVRQHVGLYVPRQLGTQVHERAARLHDRHHRLSVQPAVRVSNRCDVRRRCVERLHAQAADDDDDEPAALAVREL